MGSKKNGSCEHSTFLVFAELWRKRKKKLLSDHRIARSVNTEKKGESKARKAHGSYPGLRPYWSSQGKANDISSWELKKLAGKRGWWPQHLTAQCHSTGEAIKS